MHLNYFALRHYSAALNKKLYDSTLIHSFSISKEEIIFAFLTPENKEIFLSIHLINRSCYFYLHENYNRPRKNFLYQFEEADGGIVENVSQINFDRSFYIQLKTGYRILFKLHGHFSNILLVNPQGETSDFFRKELQQDAELNMVSLGKNMDLNGLLSDEIKEYETIKQRVPLFDSITLSFLKNINFLGNDISQRKVMIDQFFVSDKITYYLIVAGADSRLQIFPETDALIFQDAIEAYNSLTKLMLPSFQLNVLKKHIEQQFETRTKKLEKQILSNTKHLENASAFIEYENTGHIIMANMHAIPIQSSNVDLFDFYQEKTVTIRLDKNLNAQENAEKYYRKSKALKLDIPQLHTAETKLKNDLHQIALLQNDIQEIHDYKTLKSFATQHKILKPDEEEIIFPFRKMLVDNFELWIGKNAANNDLLTFRYAHKNDIWLHARDVAGSHVIIKNQPGKIVPPSIIEKAASITAFYSKAKNQSLAVVQYTTKKFVVKPRNRNPGEVNLLSEQTIMVKPGGN